MKAVIPVAGTDTPVAAASYLQSKPLLPVGNKPVLGHIITDLLAAGIHQVVFVVGHIKEKIENYVQHTFQDRLEAVFVEQYPRKGLAHALWVARDHFSKEDEILVVLGDAIFEHAIQNLIKLKGSILAVQEVENPREFGITRVDEANQVIEVREKPPIPMSNLALVGLYKFSHVSLLIDTLEKIVASSSSTLTSYSLTDAIMQMIQKGTLFHTYTIENWYNCGSKATLLQSNKLLLQRGQQSTHYATKETIVIPPVFIDSTASIRNSIIGPYVSIGPNAQISNASIRDSLVGARARVSQVQLTHSILANDTLLKGKTTQIMMGDNSEIDLDQ